MRGGRIWKQAKKRVRTTFLREESFGYHPKKKTKKGGELDNGRGKKIRKEKGVENNGVVLNVNGKSNHNPPLSTCKRKDSDISFSVPFMKKLMAEVVGTYFLIFAGCASVVVNVNNEKVVSLPGISIVWGLAVMVLVYSVGHISCAYFNPTITIAFASCKRFPLRQVPAYISAQVLGSTMAVCTLRLLFSGPHDVFVGTSP